MHTSIEFEKLGDILLLLYRPRDDDDRWVYDRFRQGENLTLKGTFHLKESDLFTPDGSENDDTMVIDRYLEFQIGQLKDDYYILKDHILDIDVPVFLSRKCDITWKWFTAERRVSIFRQIANLRPRRIVIGGYADDAIPEEEFIRLINHFPTIHELHRYSLARVASVLREYMDTTVDAERLYHRYVERHLSRAATDLGSQFREFDQYKFRVLHDRLQQMLQSEGSISEAQWQAEILQIIRLLNPRYIQAFEKVWIRDLDGSTNREIDIMLIDASGNIDLVEIKKPFDKSIVSEGTYRSNHIPLRELSGAIMQLEKYIYYLNRWGMDGENELTDRFSSDLPSGFKLRIINPNGIVISGRDNNLTQPQRRDFEVVKRKYKNIVDIITYDELLRRLDFVIRQLTTDVPPVVQP